MMGNKKTLVLSWIYTKCLFVLCIVFSFLLTIYDFFMSITTFTFEFNMKSFQYLDSLIVSTQSLVQGTIFEYIIFSAKDLQIPSWRWSLETICLIFVSWGLINLYNKKYKK